MNITIVVAGAPETGTIMICDAAEKIFEEEPEEAAGMALKFYGVG